MKLKYGTRGSALAIAQSDWVARELVSLNPGLELERVVIHTSGDRFAPAAGDNLKAMFVKEIEESLLSGGVDFGVHSCKDLPGDIPAGLVLGAFPKREDPRDAYIGGAAKTLSALKTGDKIGSSSLRRRIQLKLLAPSADCVPLRGNVDTRLKKLSEGAVSGLLLASAGLRRLGRAEVPHELIPADRMVPAPGQGTLALEARKGDDKVLNVISKIDHPETRAAAECEREFLRAMGGDCRSPLGAYAICEGGEISLSVFWSDGEGRGAVRRTVRGRNDFESRLSLAAGLAQEILKTK